MIIKGTGFLLILASALILSAQYFNFRKRRAETIRSYAELLEQMCAELEMNMPPMPELLDKLSMRAFGSAHAFLIVLTGSLDELGGASFRQLWQRALCFRSQDMDKDCFRELAELGDFLGRYSLKAQCDAIRCCSARLRKLEERRRRQLAADRRIYTGLALSGAALLGILLL